MRLFFGFSLVSVFAGLVKCEDNLDSLPSSEEFSTRTDTSGEGMKLVDGGLPGSQSFVGTPNSGNDDSKTDFLNVEQFNNQQSVDASDPENGHLNLEVLIAKHSPCTVKDVGGFCGTDGDGTDSSGVSDQNQGCLALLGGFLPWGVCDKGLHRANGDVVTSPRQPEVPKYSHVMKFKLFLRVQPATLASPLSTACPGRSAVFYCCRYFDIVGDDGAGDVCLVFSSI